MKKFVIRQEVLVPGGAIFFDVPIEAEDLDAAIIRYGQLMNGYKTAFTVQETENSG